MARAISCCIVILGWKATTFFKQFAASANIFLMNFNPENLFEVPQVGDGISGPASEAPGHCCPWHPPRLLSTAGTLQPRPCRSTPPCGAAFGLRRFPGAIGRCGFGGRRLKRPTTWDDESYGQLSSVPVQQTNEQNLCLTRHLLQTVQSKKTFTAH